MAVLICYKLHVFLFVVSKVKSPLLQHYFALIVLITDHDENMLLFTGHNMLILNVSEVYVLQKY